MGNFDVAAGDTCVSRDLGYPGTLLPSDAGYSYSVIDSTPGMNMVSGSGFDDKADYICRGVNTDVCNLTDGDGSNNELTEEELILCFSGEYNVSTNVCTIHGYSPWSGTYDY